MASKIQFVQDENTTREHPNAFIVQDAMFKVNGEYVCVEPCGEGGGGGHLLGDQHVYIRLDGDDGSVDGTIDDPFRTIAGAMDYINTIVTLEGDIFLMFMDTGLYTVDATTKINHVNKIHWVGMKVEVPPVSNSGTGSGTGTGTGSGTGTGTGTGSI